MHLYALIPVVAILVSAAFAAVSNVWSTGRQPTTLMSAIFACTGLWAFGDLMTFLVDTPSAASAWIGWMFLPAWLLGPSLSAMIVQLYPELRSRLGLVTKIGLVFGVVGGALMGLSPWAVPEIIPTHWGSWTPRYGVLAIVMMPLGLMLPVYAVHQVSRLPSNVVSLPVDSSRVHAFRFAIFVSLLAVLSTDYLLPIWETPAPRLGACAIALIAAAMWMRVRHVADDLAVTPDGLAQSMLDELHDGVVLVQLDGTILAASKRFASMVGSGGTELVGRSLVARIETRLDDIFAGLEDRNSVLHGFDGASLPVSLSSSVAHDNGGMAAGAVVVFRDLREIDALRQRLLTSGRLAAIGELAAGIAHEVNNPIAFVRSDLHLLSRRLEEIRTHIERDDLETAGDVCERAAGRMGRALVGVERVAEVVGDVRSFAHVGGVGQGGSDPAALVEGAIRLARLRRGDDVELCVRDRGNHDWVESGQELKQILLVLILALVEGCEKGGRVEAALDSDARRLHINLSARRLIDDADEIARRFERLSMGECEETNAEFGLAIAAELMSQLGASLSMIDVAPGVLEVELRLPVERERAPC